MTVSPDIVIPEEYSKSLSASLNPETDALIERCMANDRSAQEILYKTYYRKMMGVCMRYIAQKDDVMEVLNAGFLKVFQNLASYNRNGAFEAWIYRIIYNTVIDHLRTRMRAVKTEDIAEAEYDTPVHAVALQKLYANDLLKLLDALPEATRTVFNMFAMEGFKHEEIAKMLDISAGTSKWHVNQARMLLKQLIEQHNLKP